MTRKEQALAAIASVKRGKPSAEELALVLQLATEAVRTIPAPIPMREIVASQRQQLRFRLADKGGWRGGCDHRPFVKDLDAFEAETMRLIADVGDSVWDPAG